MDLSIIIVSWNTRDVLAQCLNAIFASAPSCEFDVWVVDNGSSDASEKMVREKFPQVRLIENSDNVGFARANNQAIQQSEGRNIFFLNSDALVRLGAIDQMIEFIDSHSEAGFVGPILTKSDGAVLPSCHRFPTIWSEAIFVWGINARLPLISKHKSPFDLAQIYVETDWLSGAAFMVRRVVLDQVGLFDESYFMYSEEVDLEYRAKRGGWRNYLLTTAQIIHLGEQSTRQVASAMKTELLQSKLKYFKKNHGIAAAWILKMIFVSNVLTRLLIYRVQRNHALVNLWGPAWQSLGMRQGN